MLLAVDIGNTNIGFGVFREGRIIKGFCVPTSNYTLRKIGKGLTRFRIDDIIVCSVVPGVTKVLERGLKKMFLLRPYILGRDMPAPIKNLYRRPEQVGMDRLVNAYAGTVLYGWPLIIVDFGTAVTFDVISKEKEYLGGMILPGLDISLDALFQKTALLPKVKLGEPGELIGRDTKDSMLSGVVYGFAALTDGLVVRIKAELSRRAKVIGTGGNVTLIGRHCKNLDRSDKDLTLKGLSLIYKKYKNQPTATPA